MNKPPAFQFYAKDFLSSPTVRTMSLEAEGAYIHLLATAWDSDPVASLPVDLGCLQMLSRAGISEWPDIWKQIESQFPVRNGLRFNDKLKKQYEELKSFARKQKRNGRKGGAPAGNDNAKKQPKNNPTHNPKQALHLQSSSALKDLNTAQRRRGDHTPEQILQIEAKRLRERKEEEGRRESRAGSFDYGDARPKQHILDRELARNLEADARKKVM